MMRVIPFTDYTVTTVLTELSTDEIEKIINVHWQPGESLWKGNIPLSSVQPMDHRGLKGIVFEYFAKQCYLKPETDICDNDIDIQDYWLEAFPKLLWLTSEWLQKQQFVNPLMAHWNPRIQKNVVHPGMTRLNAIDMFPCGVTHVPVIYFNTGGGYSNDFMSGLSHLDWRDLFNDGWNVQTFVPDHGSLIPHFSKLIENNSDFKKQYHRLIADRMKTLKLYLNKEVNEFWHLRHFFDDANPDTEIHFANDTPTDIDRCRALICAILKREYHSETLTVLQR